MDFLSFDTHASSSHPTQRSRHLRLIAGIILGIFIGALSINYWNTDPHATHHYVLRKAASTTAQLRPVNYQGDPEDCIRPTLNIKELKEYGCRVVEKACVDQNKVTLHDLGSVEDVEYPFYDFGWNPAGIPGYEDTGTNANYPGEQQSPLFRRISPLDRFDHVDPVFSSCHVPLMWVSPWIFSYGEFVDNTFVPMYVAQQELKLFDENIHLMPIFAGYNMPSFVNNLLRPFSNKSVTSFSDAASREHVFDPEWPRCFETMLLCNLKGLYNDRPAPKYPVDNPAIYYDEKFTYDGDSEWRWWRAGPAGRFLVDYYKKIGQLVVPEKKDAEKETLQITISVRNGEVKYRNFLNLDEFVKECNAWVPPSTSTDSSKQKQQQQQQEYRSVKCTPHSFGKDFMDDLRVLQNSDVLMGHHGAELNNGWFMKQGKSVIEVRMLDFDGHWPDLYFRSLYRTENYIFYWQAQVVKDETWRPSEFEKNDAPHRFYHRDRHTVLRWADFQPIMKAIVVNAQSKTAYEKLAYEDIRWEI